MIDESLVQYTEQMTVAVSKVLTDIAIKRSLATNFHAVASMRLTNDNDVFHIQRNGCNDPVIYVDLTTFLGLSAPTLGILDRKREVAKFSDFAAKAIKLANLLGKEGNALITGDLAYAITKDRKRLRRVLISSSSNALNDRYFSVSGTITVSELLTGNSMSSAIVSGILYDDQVAALKHALSIKMLAFAETEELIDILEMARAQRTIVEKPESYTLSRVGRETITTVSYIPELHIPIEE